MYKITLIAIVFLNMMILTACQMPQQKQSLPLEIQAIQQRQFETTKRIAFGSVVSVLQDLGYIIGSADFDTGLITGNSPTTDNVASYVFLGLSRNSTTKVTAFIEEVVEGSLVSIRLNFVVNEATSSAYGQTTSSDRPILEQDVYIQTFEKIENAIFVRT